MAALPSPGIQGTAHGADAQASSGHKRTYQACIPCRRRKIRCDLGPVDNPHDPPCARCMRESKECYFSPTRRKRGPEDGLQSAGGIDVQDDFNVRSVRRRTSYEPSRPHSNSAFVSNYNNAQRETAPMLPSERYSLSNRTAQHLELSGADGANSNGGSSPDDQVTNEAAAALFQSPVNQPKDALHLLLEASGRSEDLNRQRIAGEANTLPRRVENRLPAIVPEGQQRDSSAAQATKNPNIDPSLADQQNTGHDTLSTLSKSALKTWSKFRYVLAGWLSAKEALLYVDYFYEYLSPLTPIQVMDIREAPLEVLSGEPMLVTTILTIASRYRWLSDLGGTTRSYVIHDRLGTALAAMISRMFWAQDPVRFGNKGSIQRPNSSVSLLRTMGSIESLLLLSEFHPRAMHFPPADDSGETLFPPETESNPGGDADFNDLETDKESALTAWTEPSLRSGRMCWSLIGTAMYLAHEVGIFGGYGDGRQDPGSVAERRRADRIERLLFIYITQTSGRLGIPSLFRDGKGPQNLPELEEHLFLRPQPTPTQDPAETALKCWDEISTMVRISNSTLFLTKEKTAALIESGDYFGWLRAWEPIFHKWHEKLDRLHLPKHARVILEIEYEHCRVYSMSLAVQAVLDQWTSKKNAEGEGADPALADLYRHNEPFIRDFVDAARKLLVHVVEGAKPEGFLRNCPVRTFARIISGATFLLKSLALGAKEADVKKSLGLLERTVSALRRSVVDDMHLANRIAGLLQSLTRSLGSKFIRLQGQRQGRSSHPLHPGRPDESHAGAPSTSDLPPPSTRPPGDPVPMRSSTPNIMPPPMPLYQNTLYTYDPQPQMPLYQPNPPSGSLSSGSADEEWWAMDLTSLLDNGNVGTPTGATTGFGAGTLDMNNYFGNFGPEVGGNLEVLGKLVDEPEYMAMPEGLGGMGPLDASMQPGMGTEPGSGYGV